MRNSYSAEQLNQMSSWIDEKKKNFDNSSCKEDYTKFDVNNFNTEQLEGYNIVKTHFENNLEQLLMIIIGIAGSGKSYLINCIKKTSR